ncbi:uncharacterized protein LOC111824974 [Myotis lucifugus]|uniref:uncharacterized protein LOC111824974 n=1 Tax=Myotis lucifugus TaxID=59463 RepID=UPI000CCC4B1A|nr:uncharacterized protein LOC111824974 [Myotis lucifugus]
MTQKDCAIIHHYGSRPGRPGTKETNLQREKEMRRRLLEKPREDRVSRREWSTALSATKRSSKRTEKCQMEAVGDLSKSCLGGQMEARLKRDVVGQKQYTQIFQESHLPFVIHFSLSSKICLENGWIFHYPHTKLEILKWKTVLNIAVKKLQEAIIQIKTEAAKLKKEGFNKRLILRHYNDPKPEAEVDNSPLGSQYFWLELLKGKPQMPAVQQDDPAMKKFHYALIDGSSMI